MLSKTIASTIALAALCGLLGYGTLTHASSNKSIRAGYLPITVVLPPEVAPGDVVPATVTMNAAPPQDMVVSVGSSDSSKVGYMPMDVVVRAGNTTSTFPMQVSGYAQDGVLSIYAAANGGIAIGDTYVAPAEAMAKAR